VGYTVNICTLQACFIGYDFICSAAVESCKFDNIALAVRWLLKHMPLISPAARDPEFRVLHPYAAPSEATFLQWNVGKQRAAEVSHIDCDNILKNSVSDIFTLTYIVF
jgi:hypothetical protein